ncbi:hypothetical protein ONZ43_g3838 [Nemania bipapillata]|uniref:Uncharacterized protein n=1 Tax=Nemania bipapillata TaxID=110536 RepID=A0ACC2IVP3_9PEZI|nr:hypothetical protein ONZ43_g3838 [Nemania bipapillata]
MSSDFGTSPYSAILLDGHPINDELNCSDFVDMVDWSSLGLNVLDDDFPKPERHMKGSSLTHADPSADVHETQTGYASELDISNMEADGTPSKSKPSGVDEALNMNDPETLATFTSLVLFANNPSAQRIELKACDYSHQTTIQALAMKLNLHYFLDVPSATIHLRKYSHEETVAGLGQQISSAFGDSSDPPSKYRFHGYTAGQPSQTNRSHGLFAMQVPGSSQDLRNDCNLHSSSHDAYVNDCNFAPFTKESHLMRPEHVPLPSPAVPPPLSPPRWQNIGCKRGNLLDHCPRVCLCPKIITQGSRQTGQSAITSNSENQTSQRARIHLQNAFDRLESTLDSADDAYMNVVLDILCSPIVDLSAMRISSEYNIESNLLVLAWTLIDSPSVKSILQVEHIDQTLDVMKAAITYEMEYGHSSTAELAIDCLRNCVDMLRLHEPGYLTPALHANCDHQQCRVESFQRLSAGISAFIEEFSKVIFRKENRTNERKWWLSAFYGLYIQSFVRRAIVFVEDQSLTHLRDYHPGLQCNCSNYLNLATELFEAASASYDPLMSVWSLEKEPIDHKFDVRLIKYYRLAQDALKTNLWAHNNVQSSFEFISLAFGGDPSVLRQRKNKLDIFPSLPLRPSSLRRSSSESQTRRLSSGIAAESDVIYEDEGSPCVSSPAIEVPLPQKLNNKGLGRLRESSGAKRRASSPPQSDGSLRRNDSSSSMLNVTSMRRRALSLATQNSPLSSPYLVAYDSTTSPRWNGSEDSLSNLPQLLSPDSPAPRGSHEFATGSMSLRTPSLHNKSSNESFLEMPGPLRRKRSRSNLARGKNSQQKFLCECCPKQPKGFDSAEALSAHEKEKQYECSFCGNRFRTKNEANRHENSLHIRRQIWSCSELLGAGYIHTFRRSSAQASDDDTCCFCGIQINETSVRDDGNPPVEGIWDARLRHLKDAHKFCECVTSKQFYRADHFRQHLKHSHAAVFGDGTSHLEAACMKETVPPAEMSNMI